MTRPLTIDDLRPGPTDTDIDAGALEAVSDENPLKRVADPQEIAGLICYRALAEARCMTGASLTIDGGFTL